VDLLLDITVTHADSPWHLVSQIASGAVIGA